MKASHKERGCASKDRHQWEIRMRRAEQPLVGVVQADWGGRGQVERCRRGSADHERKNNSPLGLLRAYDHPWMHLVALPW